MNTREITVTVNGRRRTVTVEVRRTLADFLREDLGLPAGARHARGSGTSGRSDDPRKEGGTAWNRR